MFDHGFPESEYLNSGSNVSFFPTVKLIIAAGLPNVKVGIREIPLFVIDTEDANFNGLWKELSLLWPNKMLVDNTSEITQKAILLTFIDDSMRVFNFCKFI
jgi:hypothetical protein